MPPLDPKILDIGIRCLDYGENSRSARVYHLLRPDGIITFADLLTRSYQQLRSIPGVGPTLADAIQHTIERHGHHLRKACPDDIQAIVRSPRNKRSLCMQGIRRGTI